MIIRENNIEINAFNGISESWQSLTVDSQPMDPISHRKPNLYILAIGVNQYENIRSLNWCANDAVGIVAAFKDQEGLMYNQVYTRVIADGESILPTADNEAVEFIVSPEKDVKTYILYDV